MTTHKIGLIGLGEISSYFVRGVELNPRTKLVAVCRKTRHPEDSEKYKAYRFYTDWKKLVDDPEVTAIIIATPPSTHPEITDYALLRNKKVIVEKPYSVKFEDAKKSIAIAEKSKTHLYFAYHAAFNPLTLQAKEQVGNLLKKGDKVASFKVIFREDVRNYHGANSWIFEPSIAGGGCLIDSGVNAMSVVYNVGVGFVVPTAVTFGFDPKFKVEISANVQWKSPDGSIKGELIQDWLFTGPEKREIEVNFKSGNKISFDYATGIVTSTINGKEEKHTVELREKGDVLPTPMAYEYRNIINDAVEAFDRKELIDPIGTGPFESIMLCYDLHNKSKSKL
jgi:predicted dehydrogenase